MNLEKLDTEVRAQWVFLKVAVVLAFLAYMKQAGVWQAVWVTLILLAVNLIIEFWRIHRDAR